MIADAVGGVALAALITLCLLVAGMLLALIRLLQGPAPADRIVALDLFSVLVVAFLAGLAIYSNEPTYLDVAIAYALVAFLGTVALARYLERATPRNRSSAAEEGE